MIKLTERQKEVIAFMRLHREEKGTLPSQAEMKRHFNFRSPNAIRTHLRLLKQKNWIKDCDNNVGYILNEDDRKKEIKNIADKMKEVIRNAK